MAKRPASGPENLRKAVDRGQTSARGLHPDPAAAPLGTDEEAAGTPTPRDAAERAFAQEVRRAPQPPSEAPEKGGLPLSVWLIVGAALAVVALVLVFY